MLAISSELTGMIKTKKIRSTRENTVQKTYPQHNQWHNMVVEVKAKKSKDHKLFLVLKFVRTTFQMHY